MKPMKYNRAMDFVALALNELVAKKNPVLAARLFAKAAEEGDVMDAIRTIEATNRYAHGQMIAASKKVKAEFEPVEEEPVAEEPVACEEPVVAEFGEDPLDEVEDEEEAEPTVATASAKPSTAKQMAQVLSRLEANRAPAAKPKAK